MVISALTFGQSQIDSRDVGKIPMIHFCIGRRPNDGHRSRTCCVICGLQHALLSFRQVDADAGGSNSGVSGKGNGGMGVEGGNCEIELRIVELG